MKDTESSSDIWLNLVDGDVAVVFPLSEYFAAAVELGVQCYGNA